MSSYLNKNIGICCDCHEYIRQFDEYTTIDKGIIHERCLEELVDDIWRDLSFIEKREILEEKAFI